MSVVMVVCPGSIDAIQGAIGAVCEAVDACITATRGSEPRSNGPDDPCERAFVAIRPPGHHCGEDTPSGFCFINNVAVGAAHGMSHCHNFSLSHVCISSAFEPWYSKDRHSRYRFASRCALLDHDVGLFARVTATCRKWDPVDRMADKRGNVSTNIGV